MHVGARLLWQDYRDWYCPGLNLFDHQGRSARLHLPRLMANPALSLENWTATTNRAAAAANALRTSQSHVSLTTQPLVLDSGRCHRHLLALQTAVAAKVSGEKKIL